MPRYALLEFLKLHRRCSHGLYCSSTSALGALALKEITSCVVVFIFYYGCMWFCAFLLCLLLLVVFYRFLSPFFDRSLAIFLSPLSFLFCNAVISSFNLKKMKFLHFVNLLVCVFIGILKKRQSVK